ncbi:hypothetical protein CHS0354_031566 [Potamilus streckersoni]|uniref:Secreted protein n=1 Tax=Potamilus streckersoni TaxID=2493646 RepID=A0AAE0SZW6_9BIVA|nr:hypothetical protein CHS0354_031566 [Potamilus streckersoni]
MKSFSFRCTGILFLLLLQYGYAVTLWDCYHWTASDQDLINARGGDQEAERRVCEVIRGHVFTGGENTQTPGCGACWCCQKQETLWKCHPWTTRDLARIKALGGGKMAEREVCDGKIGHLFTAGQNKLTPGCGSCWCCHKV